MADTIANQSIAGCSHKRRALVNSNNQEYYLNDLPDELVVEILCWLPCSAFATRCKCVCKRWSSLISSPSFPTRTFLSDLDWKDNTNNIKDNNKKELEGRFAIIARVKHSDKSVGTEAWKGIMMHFSDPVNSLSLTPLPCFGDATSAATVIGACNDLFLYCNRKVNTSSDYFICNMQTKEWFQIPSPSFLHKHDTLVGFICDPYYTYQTGAGVLLNPAYRYCIVVIPWNYRVASQFKAHLFSSTNNQWTDILLTDLPQESKLCPFTHGFAYSGMLHFCINMGVIGFDPYKIVNNVAQCRLVCRWPCDFPRWLARFGLRQGHLQTCVITFDKKFCIGVLKDYSKGEWKLEHSIEPQEWIIQDRCLVEYLDKHGHFGNVLGAHPFDPDVVYMISPSWIVMCNARMRTAQVVLHVSATSMKLYRYNYHFPLMNPVWPTPIPGPLPHLDNVIS